MGLNKKEAEKLENVTVNQEQEEDKSQVVMLTDWKQIKKKNSETNVVNMEYPDGSIIGVEISALSKATLNALSDKYEEMKGNPDKEFDKENKKWIPARKNSKEYIAWENKCKVIDNLKAAETIIAALVVKPEGNTLQEQADFLQDVFKGGQHDKLFMEILKFSGYDFNDKIEQAKNS